MLIYIKNKYFSNEDYETLVDIKNTINALNLGINLDNAVIYYNYDTETIEVVLDYLYYKITENGVELRLTLFPKEKFYAKREED